MKKNKKKILGFLILGILISARIIIHLVESKPEIDVIPGTMKMVSVFEKDESRAQIDSKVITPLTPQCGAAQKLYSDINEVKKIKSVSSRFVNTHKNIDGVIYRFRFFSVR